jgi:hypothetical protein
MIYLKSTDPLKGQAFLFCISTAIFCIWFLWYPIFLLANAGIVGVDRKLNKGTDYKKSLQMCQHDLFFLGVGSSKLSEHATELEEAIKKSSNPNNVVRFLLCDPESPQLVAFAERMNKQADSYKKLVQASIDRLEELRSSKNLNIEIRIYHARNENEMPLFRLLFVNGDTCLMSYTVFGEGIEGDLPQYFLKQRKINDKYSLYYAMKQYFENLWKSSTPI